MPNLKKQLRWYSKKFEKIDFKKKNPVRIDSVEYFFAIIDSKAEAENTARTLRLTLEENSRDFVDLPESINHIPYRMLWIKSPLVLEKKDIESLYSGVSNHDPQMYSAYKKNGMTGLREYIHTQILQFAPAVKKSRLARFLMF